MKKTWMIAAAMVAMLSLASCQKDQPACWEVKISIKVMGQEIDAIDEVLYGTESQVDAMVKDLTKVQIPGAEVKVDKKKLDKSEADCI